MQTKKLQTSNYRLSLCQPNARQYSTVDKHLINKFSCEKGEIEENVPKDWIKSAIRINFLQGF